MTGQCTFTCTEKHKGAKARPYEITEDTYLGAMESVEEDGPIMLLFLAHAPPSRLVNQIPPNTILYCVIMDRKGLNWEMGAIEAKFNV